MESSEFTQLLRSASEGDRESANRLYAFVYQQMREMAYARMSSENSQTLQPTALVHETWMRMMGTQAVTWNDQSHFFAMASQAMRRLLVDSARARRAIKRGGDARRLDLLDADCSWEPDEQLLALNEALKLLKEHDERKASVVELRYFAGLSNSDIALQLGVSVATVERDWAYARAWLRVRMESE